MLYDRDLEQFYFLSPSRADAASSRSLVEAHAKLDAVEARLREVENSKGIARWAQDGEEYRWAGALLGWRPVAAVCSSLDHSVGLSVPPVGPGRSGPRRATWPRRRAKPRACS